MTEHERKWNLFHLCVRRMYENAYVDWKNETKRHPKLAKRGRMEGILAVLQTMQSEEETIRDVLRVKRVNQTEEERRGTMERKKKERKGYYGDRFRNETEGVQRV